MLLICSIMKYTQYESDGGADLRRMNGDGRFCVFGIVMLIIIITKQPRSHCMYYIGLGL